MRCLACGLVNFAASEFCRRCGRSLADAQGTTTSPLPGPLPSGNPSCGYPGVQSQDRTNPGIANNQPPPQPFYQGPPPPGTFNQPPLSGPVSQGQPYQAPPGGPFYPPPPPGSFNPPPPPGSFNPPPPPGSFGNVPPNPYTAGSPPDAAPYASAPNDASAYPPAYPYPYPGAPPAQLRQGMAIASLVLGCTGLLSCVCFLFGLGSIAGLVLGIVATQKAKNYPAEYGGKTMAIIGIVLSAFSIAVYGIFLAVTLIHLLASMPK